MAATSIGNRHSRYVAGAVSALLCTLLGQIFLIFGVGDALTQLSYDIPFALRSDVKPAEVLVVYMDEESHHLLKQHSRFDLWDRVLHARLIDQLKKLGAKAVVFDVLFDAPTEKAADDQLVAAARNHGNVYVAGIVGSEVFNHQVIGTKPIRPFDELLNAVKGWGMVEWPDSGDGVIRQQYSGALTVPSLSWMVATQTTHGIALPSTQAWMNYYGPAGTIPWASYHQIISNTIAPSLVSNRVVYVGGLFSIGWSGGKGTDDFRTPYTRWDREHRKSPGVELNATAFLNLVRGDSLARSSPLAEVIGITLLGSLVGFGLMALRPVSGGIAAVLLAFGVGSVACAIVWTGRLWTPWLIPVVIQIPMGLVCSVLVRTQRLGSLSSKQEDGVQVAAVGSGGAPVVATGVLQRELARLRQEHAPAQPPIQATRPETELLCPAIPNHEMLKCVGKGAYGEVWLARNVLGAYRAVKLIYRRNFSETKPYEREFDGIRHFEPISRSHPCLVPILHVGRDDDAGYYFYLMDPADDMDLGPSINSESYVPKTLGREINKRGCLPTQECLDLAFSLSLGLAFLHDRGLLHRDIKPSNIIFINGVPKLADIGLVTSMDESISFVGTQGYFPPEGPGMPSADLYSLGKVLYQCLTGLPCSRFPELPANVGPEHAKAFGRLNDIVLRACHPEARKRYQTCGELQADLTQAKAGGKRPWFGR